MIELTPRQRQRVNEHAQRITLRLERASYELHPDDYKRLLQSMHASIEAAKHHT